MSNKLIEELIGELDEVPTGKLEDIISTIRLKLEAFEELRKDVERILGRIGEVIEWEFREGNTYHHITATKLKELHDSLLIKWGRI